MPDVPAPEWGGDVVLADGGTARIREARAGDADRVRAFVSSLSDATLRLRFFSPVTRELAARLTDPTGVDDTMRFQLLAEVEGEVVALAEYDRSESGGDAAEVAFLVADRHQHRGFGSLLLEHLAAAARAAGIARFTAFTLPDNQGMLEVFRDAGFVVERTRTSDAIALSFPIGLTDDFLAAHDAREHFALRASVHRVLAPRSIAVVGAGRRPRTIGHEVLRNLVEAGFNGPVYAVNPNAERIAGVRAYPSVDDIDGAVDLAVVAVPAPAVAGVVEACARKGVQGLVVITAGFAEVGGAGVVAERDLLEAVRGHGMRMVGPNCMGIVNTASGVRMNATFAASPKPGSVAFSSQSGALGIALLSRAGAMGLGVSSFVSLGNRADLSSNDLLEYWQDDDATNVILLYLESFGNPRKFARIARRVARVKPIVAVKSGRTVAGARGASSHTAALTGPDAAADALFRQAGVIRVDTIEELFDAARVLANQPLPTGRRVAIVSNGGGPAILAADACATAGLEVPELSEATQHALRECTSSDAALRNPVDLVSSATAATYEQALGVVLDDPEVDAVAVLFVPVLVTQAADVRDAIAAAARDHPRTPMVSCFLGQEAAASLDAASGLVPSFAFPESAVAALGHAAARAAWLRRPVGEVPRLTGIDVEAARRVVDRLVDAQPSGGWVGWDDAAALSAAFGIALATGIHAGDADAAVAAAASLGVPVALKAASPSIVHKTDVGGVRLHLDSGDAVRRAYLEMEGAIGPEMGGAVVQTMVDAGVEMIVGVTHDPVFGPIVLCGMGGTAAELVRDTGVRILPLTDVDVHELVMSLRSAPLLTGYRGSQPVAMAALEELLLRVAQLAEHVPELAELDLNPVMVTVAGAVVVDVKIRIGATSGTPG